MEQSKATAADAKLILKLYDLRREPVMRQARDFVANLWPESADDILKIAMAMGTSQNAYLRQVMSYWDMAASLVLHGTLDEALFLENANEMFFVFAKVYPYLGELREKMKAPELMGNIQKVIERSENGRRKLETMLGRLKAFAELRKEAASR